MTNDEIRTLLGGYATNTLTDAERKSLFEAALDNQELFDALQEEQALKELLDNPVSRAQVRQALEKPRPIWWSRWWAWSGALTAVAAAVLIVAVVQQGPHTSALMRAKQEVPPSEPQPEAKATTAKPAPEATRIARSHKGQMADAISSRAAAEEARKDQKEEVAAAAPPPPPPAATPQVAQQTQQTPSPSQNQTQNQSRAAVSGFRDTQGAPGVGGFELGFAAKGSPLRYSLLKRDAGGGYSPAPATELYAGDAVRLSVSPIVSGYLVLSRFDNSGVWKRVFPLTGPGIPVAANISYTIPTDSAIELTGEEEKLRLTLAMSVVSPAESLGVREQAKEPAKKARAAAAPVQGTLAGAATPMSVDITITPKNP